MVFTFITFALLLVVWVINDNDLLRHYSALFFLIELAAIIYVGKQYNFANIYFFSPCFIMAFYVTVNFALGFYAMDHNYNIAAYQYRTLEFMKIKSIVLGVSYTLICVWLSIMLFNVRYKIKPGNEAGKPSISTNSGFLPYKGWPFYKVIIALGLILAFSFVEINMDFLGGNGDFSIIPKTIVAIILFYELSNRRIRYRWLVYLFTFGIFVLTNYNSKREAFFLIITILFLESVAGNIKVRNFSFKYTLFLGLAAGVLVVALIVMTIARGYGGYQLGSAFDAVKYVPVMLADENFIGFIFTTSEAPTTCYHSLKAIEMISRHPDYTTYGSTLAKVFFVPIPKDVFGFKPLSMTSIFTKLEAPALYRVGGSLPVNMYAEMYWNFNILGIPAVGLLMALLNHLYKKLYYLCMHGKRSVLVFTLLFAYTYLVGFFRGYGLDLYMVYVIMSIPFAYLVGYLLYKIIKY
jgi:hypothetical protein